MKNPFPYSLDNKRYLTWNYYCLSHYGRKLYKVPIDAYFTCPNRDGSISKLGCLFCKGGSDAFPTMTSQDLMQQFYHRKEIFTRKWPDGLALAYFQAYSNTYGSIEQMQKAYQRFVNNDDVFGLVIATRCDCLDKEKIAYLQSIAQKKLLWLEIGLQSIHDTTLKQMNRGHSYQQFLDCLTLLQDTNINISVHIINGWPSETKEMMLKTAIEVGKLPIKAVKIHMLHVLKDTPLAKQYPFELLTQQQYVEIVAQQLSYLKDTIVIERLTGDGLKDDLIAPLWTMKKTCVLNDIDKEMVKKNYWQGLNFTQ